MKNTSRKPRQHFLQSSARLPSTLQYLSDFVHPLFPPQCFCVSDIMYLKPEACGLFYSTNRFCEGFVQEATESLSLEINLSYEKHFILITGLFSGSSCQVLIAQSLVSNKLSYSNSTKLSLGWTWKTKCGYNDYKASGPLL